jgi:group I intron endonuclease
MKSCSKYPKGAGIYKLTCIINGKTYIGKSVNFYNRFSAHKYSEKKLNGSYRLQRAIIKHGWNSFNIEILEEFPVFDKLKDNEKLLEKESYYIELFDSTNPQRGYNTCKFSRDRTGVNHSEETKQKISLANLGRKREPMSEETKKRMSQSALGKVFSEETREKLRQANLGKTLSEEHKEKLRLVNLGKTISEETRKKLSEINKGKPSNRKDFKHSEESKKKIGDAVLGRKHSEESKKRMSLAQTGIKNKRPGYKHSDETKEKMRQAAINRKLEKDNEYAG